ncbi:MAG: radical SAM protein [Deltaproteobacteria bacterium]|nr:radical SAM protein [Deltaproteobacteria bacterium]
MARRSAPPSLNARQAEALGWDLQEIAIELTVHCNLRCAMCSVWQGRKHGASGELARDLLAQARALGASSFVPCGGECFMREDFTELLQHADRLGFERSEVVTNGLLVEAQLEKLAELRSVHLHVSLDGPPEVHDALRGQGVYARALSAVEAAVRLGVPTGLSGVLMRPTLDTVEHLVDLHAELGLRELSLQPYQPEIDGQDRDPSRWLFEPAQRARVMDRLAEIRAYARERGVKIYTESVLDHVPAYLFDGLRPIPPGGCFMPSRFVLIDIDGDVYPCFFMREDVMGNVVRGDRLEAIWHDEMHTALQMLALSSRCPGCLAACSDIATFDACELERSP